MATTTGKTPNGEHVEVFEQPQSSRATEAPENPEEEIYQDNGAVLLDIGLKSAEAGGTSLKLAADGRVSHIDRTSLGRV